jgi:prepilin-type N-terminal cleavage/methylation domain-containing protein
MSLPSIPSQARNRKISSGGFTLVELLMVFAVIAILAAITFGITRGVQNAQNRAKAKVELAAISQALEQYKARYGDYPWHDSGGSYPSTAGDVTSTVMLYALTGRIEFDPSDETNPVSKISDSLENAEVENRPKFLDLTKFDYAGSDEEPEALLDPWGNPYIYWYKREGDSDVWDVFGYHLYSTGPNGEEANDAIKGKMNTDTGVLDDDFRVVADAEGIIFAGE